MNLSVREIQEQDIPLISDYWVNATSESLLAMGAIKEMVPDQKYWQEALLSQIKSNYAEKQSYCTIWLVDGEPIGHCNVNKIIFGQEAYMHLQLWKADKRQSGLGTSLVKLSLPYFFQNLQLKTLFCEPYALNPAPNSTLKKLGFDFVKEYITVPGSFSFEQPTNRWELSLEKFNLLF
ncbi:GNAT family N-acetyltransferase [Taibaiella lutea]|uniref:GNAT family N-acetyltransferase n=1 Tax=Taibaiella lutea TaxID=2608001 RepID=A0A5M6CAX1_9BACT|nr:GNAT family protein [Taibaiella lutea]KAA5532143.1 GNAT family N-acetyltransferase [Taibaiella lutea]